MPKLTDDDLRDMLSFMESSSFKTRFAHRVHLLAQDLRVAALKKSGAQPCLLSDLASIEERIAWLKPHVEDILDNRKEQLRQRQQNMRLATNSRSV